MPLTSRLYLLASLFAACTPSPQGDPAKAVANTQGESKAAVSKPSDATPSPTPSADPTTPVPAGTVATPTITPPADASTPTSTPTVPPAVDEIAINPWSITGHTPVWTPQTAPSKPITFEPQLYAGVLGKAGTAWHQVGDTGELVPLTMDTEPQAEVLGVWPSDAWFVQSRSQTDADFQYQELRLMKLRGGDRWVPQTYGGHEQWFHPGTGMDEFGASEYDDAHMSPRSGMLMYPGTLEIIRRVAGKHDNPVLGMHRGRAIDFFETGAGKIYIISIDGGSTFAQTECQDDACVAAKAKALPLDSWRFGRRVARGKHSVSVVATSESRKFILHHRGKSDGWLLDELPAGETLTGMWNSEEGGLWTTHGEHVRWRDTESVWREIALPEGLSAPSVALSADRKTVWVAGSAGGVGKVFTTAANATAP